MKNKNRKRLPYNLIALLIWTVLLALLLGWNLYNNQQTAIESAKIKARALWEKDIIFRAWNAEHNGVYVPVTESSQPNPYLDVQERDIQTTLGKQLTLINPAYMTRQMYEIAERDYAIQGHITSLNPIRPENKADGWETKALRLFESGQAEYSTIVEEKGKQYLRLMKPLITEQSCLSCHEVQGYKVGDVRGGISVNVPMEGYIILSRKHALIDIWAYLMIWGIGAGAIFWVTNMVEQNLQTLQTRQKQLENTIIERKQAENALRASEEKHRLFFENAPIGIIHYNPKGVITDVNEAVIATFGSSRERLVGLSIESVPDKEFAKEIYKSLNGAPGYFEGEYVSFTGKKASYIRTDWIPVTKDGEILACVGIIEDITERKQAEEALRKSEENLRITLNSIGDAVIVTNTTGNISSMNPVAEKMTGWKQQEALGKALADIFRVINSQSREAVENPVEKVLKAGKIVETANHSTLVGRNGIEYQIADSAAPIRDVKESLTGVVLVFRDVTEKLRAELEQQKTRKLESVGVLAGGIAHDFNNLLTGLFGNIETAKLSLPPTHQAYKFLEAAGRSMERATRLTKQLLTFAKGGEPIKEMLSLGEVITETAQFSMRGSKVKLQSNIALDLWPVEADKGQLSQVISNLVINAQQAMPTGGAITVTAENVETSEGKVVQIKVKDRGEGIAGQHLDKIFDPYFSTKEEGSGLGLASTHSIISKHNGTIRVETKVGQGTTFIVQLPASEKAGVSTAGTLLGKIDTQPEYSARVLVMDDEEMVREVIGAMLKRMGCRVTYAVEGQEAARKYETAQKKGDRYDVVITDLTIPGGLGGQGAAWEILKRDPEASIIVSSGYATDPVMANHTAYGFKGIVVKPYRFADLQKVIQQLLQP